MGQILPGLSIEEALECHAFLEVKQVEFDLGG